MSFNQLLNRKLIPMRTKVYLHKDYFKYNNTYCVDINLFNQSIVQGVIPSSVIYLTW